MYISDNSVSYLILIISSQFFLDVVCTANVINFKLFWLRSYLATIPLVVKVSLKKLEDDSGWKILSIRKKILKSRIQFVNVNVFFHFSLTLLLGIIGNLLILVAILGYKKMKSPTNVFLASLALADLLLCLICIPVKVRNLYMNNLQKMNSY